MPQPRNDLKKLLEQSSGQSDSVSSKNDESIPESQQQRCPARRGKKLITGYFDKDTHYQLKLLSLETGKSIQALLQDALNALFEMHDKPPIA